MFSNSRLTSFLDRRRTVGPTHYIAKPNADLLLLRLQFHRQNSFDDLNSFTGLLNALLQLHMHES